MRQVHTLDDRMNQSRGIEGGLSKILPPKLFVLGAAFESTIKSSEHFWAVRQKPRRLLRSHRRIGRSPIGLATIHALISFHRANIGSKHKILEARFIPGCSSGGMLK